MSKYIQILSKYALFTIAAEKKGPQGATSILFSFHVKVLHSFKAKKKRPTRGHNSLFLFMSSL